MKKIISVFCTLMLLSLSANATPPAFQSPSSVKKTNKTEHRADVRKLEYKHRAAVLKNKQQTVSQNQNDVKTYAVQGLSQRKATQANKEITIQRVSSYYDAGEITYYFSGNDDMFECQLVINLSDGQQDVELGKIYTREDMGFSWIVDQTTAEDGELAESMMLSEASFKKSLNPDNTNHYEVSATPFWSPDTYSFVFDEPKAEEFVPNGDTIYINFAEQATLDYYTGDNSVEWRAINNDYDVQITYFPNVADSPVGTYTEEDCDLSYTNVSYGIARPKTVTAEIEVTQDANKYELTANLLCDDGYVYAVTMFRNIAQAENSVEITSTNLVIDGSWASDFGIVWVEASDDTYFVELMVSAPAAGAALAGTYEANVGFKGWIYDDNDGEYTIEAGSITIEYNEGNYTVTGQVLAENNTEYTLNLTYTLPEPTEQTLTLDNLILYKFNGGWQVYGYSADSTKLVTLAAYSDKTSGQFIGSELAPDYSYIVLNPNQDDEALYDLVDADIILTPNEDYTTATITGTFLGLNYYDPSDAVRFTLNLAAEELDPTQAHYPYDTESGEYNEDFELYTVSARSTYFVIEAEKDNGAYVMLAVYPAAGQTQLTAGTYDITMNSDYMTVAAGMSTSDGSLYPSFASYIGSNGYITDLWLLEAGTMTISETGEITVEALNSYAQTVKFTLAEANQALEYDTNDDFVHDFESYEYYDDFFDVYGMLEVYYESDEYVASIMFITDSNPLKPGVYPINNTYEMNTVIASSGYDEEYGPNPSYIATLIDYYGQLYLNDLWYMVGGTVTVNEDGIIEVDAVNSYGKSIKSKLGVSTTSVETVTDTTAAAVKRVVEGNLFIESNGRVFNAQGALIK